MLIQPIVANPVSEFVEEVCGGLTKPGQKELPSKFLYDEVGSRFRGHSCSVRIRLDARRTSGCFESMRAKSWSVFEVKWWLPNWEAAAAKDPLILEAPVTAPPLLLPH